MRRCFLFFFIFTSWAQAQSLDERLTQYIQIFNLQSIQKKEIKDKALFLAGEILFRDKILSGNRNISCLECHDPAKGTGDHLPLSLGQGALVLGNQRFQNKGKIIRRNSPPLFNLADNFSMFWDGRVFVDPFGESFITPEKALNGKTPLAWHIVKNLKRALDAQVLFPMVSHSEMMGNPLENEIASASNNIEAWNLLVQRIIKEKKNIIDLLMFSYGLSKDNELNIGHVAGALGEFIAYNFQVYNTPYDRYLRGEVSALNEKAKLGMEIFLNKARCINCHNGKHLSNFSFQNIGIPNLLENKESALDYGLFEINKREGSEFRFKTPTLRNVGLTAPYMHNGIMKNLEEVVEHYNDVKTSIIFFSYDKIFNQFYNNELFQVVDQKTNDFIYSGVNNPFLRAGLKLTKEEKENLVYFLRYGLRDNYTF